MENNQGCRILVGLGMNQSSEAESHDGVQMRLELTVTWVEGRIPSTAGTLCQCSSKETVEEDRKGCNL